MTPSGLNHAYFRVSEKLDSSLQEVWLRNKIGIKNADELTFSRCQPSRQGSGFEAGTIFAMNQGNVEAPLPQLLGTGGGNLPCVIGGIVQHLDLQQVPRVIEFADGAQQSLNHVHFIEDRQLHRHFWQLIEPAGGLETAIPVLQKQVNNEITVNAIGGQPEEHTEVTNGPDQVTKASVHRC